MEHLRYAIETLVSSGFCYYICDNLTAQGILGIILRGVICVVITGMFFLICNLKNPFLKSFCFLLFIYDFIS